MRAESVIRSVGNAGAGQVCTLHVMAFLCVDAIVTTCLRIHWIARLMARTTFSSAIKLKRGRKKKKKHKNLDLIDQSTAFYLLMPVFFNVVHDYNLPDVTITYVS